MKYSDHACTETCLGWPGTVNLLLKRVDQGVPTNGAVRRSIVVSAREGSGLSQFAGMASPSVFDTHVIPTWCEGVGG